MGTGRAASGCVFTRGVATLAADRAVPFTPLTAMTVLLSQGYTHSGCTREGFIRREAADCISTCFAHPLRLDPSFTLVTHFVALQSCSQFNTWLISLLHRERRTAPKGRFNPLRYAGSFRVNGKCCEARSSGIQAIIGRNKLLGSYPGLCAGLRSHWPTTCRVPPLLG